MKYLRFLLVLHFWFFFNLVNCLFVFLIDKQRNYLSNRHFELLTPQFSKDVVQLLNQTANKIKSKLQNNKKMTNLFNLIYQSEFGSKHSLVEQNETKVHDSNAISKYCGKFSTYWELFLKIPEFFLLQVRMFYSTLLFFLIILFEIFNNMINHCFLMYLKLYFTFC